MRRVIINADDLGFNQSANEAIARCLDAGVITSSTIMAAGEAIDGVTDIVKSHPEASFGVHLCLDEVRPISTTGYFAQHGLLDKDGILIKGWYKDVKPTNELIEAVYNEWKTQIAHIQSLEIPISHLDSHHHAHNLPFLKDVLQRLAREFKIDRVRLPQYISPLLRRKLKTRGNPIVLQNKTGQGKLRKLVNYVLGIISKNKETKWMKKTFKTTDFFCHANTFFNNASVLQGYETIEIMCHPGHSAYDEETKMLYEFDYGDIQIITYKDL